MNNYTTAVVFDRKKKASKDIEGLLEIRISANRKSYYISTGVRVLPKQWAGTVLHRADAETLNDRLGSMVRRVSEEVTRCQNEGHEIDVTAIREKLFEVKNPRATDPDVLLNWIDAQIAALNVAKGTRYHFRVMQKRLEAFGRIRQWEDLTTENIYEWDAWLHKLPKPQSNGDRQAGKKREYISDASVHNYHKDLRSLLSRAVKMGKMEQNPYDRLHGEFKKNENESTEYLTEEEMKALESLHPLPGTQMAMARDLFVFQMYTGLSYSDAQAFDIGDYKREAAGGTCGGERWVHVGQRIKTGVAYVSQLLPPVVEILKRYNWQTPKINNTQYNQSLKVIQKALGFTSKLHSHLARHTFATWMLSNGVPLEHVSKMIGHTNIRQTQRYAKVMPTAIFDDFEKVARNLAGKPQDTLEDEGKV
jgi:site-specific recombinase XerD